MMRAELDRLALSGRLEQQSRAEKGQYLTPAPIASLMAAMLSVPDGELRWLDPGAGIGTLSAALASAFCQAERKPKKLSVTAYEIDNDLVPSLHRTLERAGRECRAAGIDFDFNLEHGDFIAAAVAELGGDLFGDVGRLGRFGAVIANPPYRKIRNGSPERLLLRRVGIEANNLYAGFLALAARLLDDHGQMVAITPRSFCNGPYFKSFRKEILENLRFRRFHLFGSRSRLFESDRVLQENVIFLADKQLDRNGSVLITSSEGPEDLMATQLELEHDELVSPGDPNSFVHLVTNDLERSVARRARKLDRSLADLGLEVSTGRVVEFRARGLLRKTAGPTDAPLVHPTHFEQGFVRWPGERSKRPIAIADREETRDLLIESGVYVLVKRFTSKEERRRVVAAIFDPSRVSAARIGLENHLNYIHRGGRGFSMSLAKGLAAFLCSTLVDAYFRQFNGHTQVNATDLRSLGYPEKSRLISLGRRIGDAFPCQDEIDHLVQRILFDMSEDQLDAGIDPIAAKRRIREASKILKLLGFPRAQQNERSALTLLALLDLRAGQSWSSVSNPQRGITELMDFMASCYGKQYAPNTRETIRKATVHQFVLAGVVLKNPDEPQRPTNSPKTVYQVDPILLDLLRSFGTETWTARLDRYLASAPTLKAHYSRERRMERVPLRLQGGETISLSPGGQSLLVKRIVDDFCPLYAPGGKIVYVGDTAKKFAFFDRELLGSLGVSLPEHGKMPDVVIHLQEKNWLLLIEAVESQGPMDAKRQYELRQLFLGASAGLVFVTAFPDRKTLAKHLASIAWETEVWIAESPTHLIHFNGERFLGPYEEMEEAGSQ